MKKRFCLFLSLCLVFIMCITVTPLNAAATYKLNASSRTLNGVGKKCTLTLTAPRGTKATWKSSSSAIASVSSKGIVTAKKKGSVTITCTAKKGTLVKKLTCKVTVKVPAKAVEFTNAVIDEEYDAHIIELGTTYDFNARTISSSSKSSSTDVIRFYLKDTTKADVNEKTGLVTPKKAGYTTLTACCGATAEKAAAPENTKKQSIHLFIKKPSVTVVDCGLLSSHELLITFNQAMDPSTLLANTKLLPAIAIQGDSKASQLGTLTGSISEDQKILTIHSQNAFNGVYTISLGKTIKSMSGYPLTPFSESRTLKDTVGPTYLGCTVDDTGLIVSLNFNEPVSITNLVAKDAKRSDGKTLVNPAAFTTTGNYKLSEDQKSILLDLTGLSPVDQNAGISLTLYGIVDLANNPTNPYPLIAAIYTNTTSTGQAQLQNLYRNGNSVVAVFDKSIQIPGYALVNNVMLNGEVNKFNKKEVIYQILDTGLLNTKTSVSAVLYNYSAYNAGATATSMQRTINFGTACAIPAVTSSSFTTKKGNSSSSTVLTLTFNEPVTLLASNGKISGKSMLDGIIGAETSYNYTAEASQNIVTLTFTNTFTDLATYSFTLPDFMVLDGYYNYNGSQTITVTKEVGETAALPAPSAIQLAGNANQYIYITFDNMLDNVSAENKANYSISGVTVQSAQLVSNSYGCPSVVKLTVAPDPITANAPYPIKISNIKGYKNAYSAMEPYSIMIILTNNQALEPSSLKASATGKTITLDFPVSLRTGNPHNANYTVTVNGNALTVEDSKIKSNQIILTLKETLTKGQLIQLKPLADNYIMDMNNQRLLNLPITITAS
ncbi:Ig-like domain-containing protein [[Clostridium] polysaccharolyticum]|uniref:Repeat-containing protein n=1 Tax=[Clostridium] polysaccharolyticum TaxID=29364 RepID=A0A1H9ZF49_9FIRM|nr:Ig-like domain-containing protein [[Clostridium] polysaccharolyticum]SES80219.1 repeat-containing protein [[Clostridium] polysaccharolyticum]